MSDDSESETPAGKLRSLITDIRVAMFTTLAPDGTFHTRPMATMEPVSVDELWFFSASDSTKNGEIDETHCVGLSYSDPARQRYVAVCGTAQIIRDPDKARELWNGWAAAWFPAGPADPTLRLVRVVPHKAEYWDSSSHRMALLFQTVKATLGAKPKLPPGEHATIELNR